jgi:hypothetical protein
VVVVVVEEVEVVNDEQTPIRQTRLCDRSQRRR